MEAVFKTSRQAGSRLVAAVREPGSAYADALRDNSTPGPAADSIMAAAVATDAPQPAPSALPERLDTRSATALAKALAPCRERAMALDASSVRFVGARCAELLLAAQLAAQEHGTSLQLANPSDDFIAGLAALGLDGMLAAEGAASASGVTP